VFSPAPVAVIVLTIGATGCGSTSKITSAVSSVATHATASTTAAAAEAKLKGKASEIKKSYKPGEFCSSKNEKLYKAQNLVCVNGHLKSASQIKSSVSTTKSSY